ncbi:O-antigen ligase family protein [Polaromonas sp. YR568]|uniref:O-antigen ligase family protein n=1 Tax=Polaromonas sp. YR568 TaxID=1855301 RepID=UPI00313831A4
MSILHVTTQSQDNKLSSWQSKEYLLFGSALFIYLAVFSGRFSVSRIFSTISHDWSVLGELRTWAILLSAVLVFIGSRKCRAVDISRTHLRWVWVCVSLVVAGQLFLIFHAILYVSENSSLYFIWELMTIILSVCILGFAFQVWGRQFVIAAMWLALFFALFIALWMFIVIIIGNKTENGRALATTFTFYRIQIFGCFAALVILFESNKIFRAGLLGLCATICLAASYITLSKAALLAGAASMLVLAAIYVTWFSKIRASIVFGISTAAVILFVITAGSMFAARSAEGLLGTGYALSTDAVMPPVMEEATKLEGSTIIKSDEVYYNIKNASLVAIEFAAQKRLAEVIACTAGKYPCSFKVHRWEQDIADTMLRFRVYLPDFSFRIRLLMQGFSGIAKAPWMGNGFGGFNAVAINLYTKQPELYSHPHNIAVELLYSVGVLGTLFIFGIIFILLWIVLQARNSIMPGLPMLAFIFSVAIGSLFGGDYMDFRLVWIGFLFCMMLLPRVGGLVAN